MLKQSEISIIIKILITIILSVSAVLTFNTANASSTSQCAQFQGDGLCTPPSHPISDWIYMLGNNSYTSEEETINALKRSYNSTCETVICDVQGSGTGWPENTPFTQGEPPIGVVWTRRSIQNDEVNFQQKNVDLYFNGVKSGSFRILRGRDVETYRCPEDATLITDDNPSGYPLHKNYQCLIPKPETQCPSTNHPCSITSGNKFKPQLDWQSVVGPLQFSRTYNSLYSGKIGANLAAPLSMASLPSGYTYSNSQASIYVNTFTSTIGSGWSTNYNLQIIPQNDRVLLLRGNGIQVVASSNFTDATVAGTSGWFINRNFNLTLKKLADGTWQVTNVKTQVIENYDINGRLTQIKYPNNQFVTLSYQVTSGSPAVISYNPTTVVDNFGQTITFHYNAANLLTSVSLPTGRTITYTYDAQNRLSTVARPGYGTKTYLYSENSTVAPSGNPNLLTGILDEKGTRYESYAYDSSDRGISTSMAGGVEKYSLNYSSDGYNAVTDPHGLTKNYYITTASGSPVVGTTVLMNSGNSTTQEDNYSYDKAGNIVSKTHFGTTTTYTYDLTRNLETSRTEAVGTPQERTITTQWDTTLPVPLLITEPGKKTAYTYDANGNTLTRTITDTVSSVSRVWTYTYNTVGQKLTEKTPAGETTTYVYDSKGRLTVECREKLTHL